MANNDKSDEYEDIDCIEAIDKLYAWLDHEIKDIETIRKLEYHLEHCHSCFTRSQLETALTTRIREAAKKQTPESLQKRLRDIANKYGPAED